LAVARKLQRRGRGHHPIGTPWKKEIGGKSAPGQKREKVVNLCRPVYLLDRRKTKEKKRDKG